jgi:hypothetical protein
MSRNLVTIIGILLTAITIIGIMPEMGTCLTDAEKDKIEREDQLKIKVRKRQQCVDDCKKFIVGDDLSMALDCTNTCDKMYGNK